jgi:hypothetical protein
LCFDGQGKFLFAYDQPTGKLSRIRMADLVLEASANHPFAKSNLLHTLTWSAEGLVLTDTRRVLLALKNQFKPQRGVLVCTSPDASVALGIHGPTHLRKMDVLFDLKGLSESPLTGLPSSPISSLHGRCLAADGKAFFMLSPSGTMLQRYLLKDTTLELAEETRISVRYPMVIAQRRDSKYIAPYSTSDPQDEIGVYESNRLAKPAFTLPGTARALCFLQPGGHILRSSGDLELFSDTGSKIKSYRWAGPVIYSLIPHPRRPAALAMTVQGAYYLELTELKNAEK